MNSSCMMDKNKYYEPKLKLYSRIIVLLDVTKCWWIDPEFRSFCRTCFFFFFLFSTPTDNRCQNETRRRKRRWNGEQNVQRVPTGSTAPYCDLPRPVLSFVNIHIYTPTYLFGCQGTPQQLLTTGAQKGGEGGRGVDHELLDGSRGAEGKVNLTDVPSPFTKPWNE